MIDKDFKLSRKLNEIDKRLDYTEKYKRKLKILNKYLLIYKRNDYLKQSILERIKRIENRKILIDRKILILVQN